MSFTTQAAQRFASQVNQKLNAARQTPVLSGQAGVVINNEMTMMDTSEKDRDRDKEKDKEKEKEKKKKKKKKKKRKGKRRKRKGKRKRKETKREQSFQAKW
ncbi:hypothetical protein RFI_22691 [Reticulomyxa filosa]|uniref:Uncharacterized protein n=1 Tax=Reticulomyxa filosa TaxID=46433 RepID=X6MLC0_RETFI|nr:hypothetical protein RFI_22691 [Reticulomyxa filosa]|eukprot:ETO14674.1 hypothetical protein RFI_22691 [Reticulomyxa filosa]